MFLHASLGLALPPLPLHEPRKVWTRTIQFQLLEKGSTMSQTYKDSIGAQKGGAFRFLMFLKVWWSTLGCMHKLVSEACLQASERARLAFLPQCYTLSVWKEPQRGLRKQILPLDLSSSRRFVLKFVISRATWVSHICPELKTASH